MFIDFKTVREANPIESAIPTLGLVMKKSGETLRGKCPRCNGNGDRDLVITPAQGVYYCFSAKQGGDVLSLAAHVQQTSVREAAIFLSGGNGSPEPRPQRPQNQSADTTAPPKFNPQEYLDKLDPKAPQLEPLGIDWEKLKPFGGYCSRGILSGTLAIALRDETGAIVAFIGVPIEGAKIPKTLKV